MLEYLQSPEFQQLLVENPKILVGVALWITVTLVMSLLCLSQWFCTWIIACPLPLVAQMTKRTCGRFVRIAT